MLSVLLSLEDEPSAALVLHALKTNFSGAVVTTLGTGNALPLEDADFAIYQRSDVHALSSFVQNARAQKAHTLMAAITTENDSRVRALLLDSGYDEAASLPLHVDLFVARMKALLDAVEGYAHNRKEAFLRTGNVCVDQDVMRVSVNNVPISLTAREYEIFLCFMQKPEKMLPVYRIAQTVYAQELSSSCANSIAVTVARIRKKLTLAGATHTIKAKWGLKSFALLEHHIST